MRFDMFVRCYRADGETPSPHINIVENTHIDVNRYVPSQGGDNATVPSDTGLQKYTPRGHHQELCEMLLPLVTGWERLFVQMLGRRSAITVVQEVKLAGIAERHLQSQEESQSETRLCRHCGKPSQLIDQFSYHCNRCGTCLNLEWRV